MAKSGVIHPDLIDAPVIITGGADGIGRAIAEAFAAQGARVGLIDIDGEKLHRLAGEVPGLVTEQADLRDIPAAQAALARLAKEIGAPQVLVNNAANDTRHNFQTLEVAEWDERMAVNLRHAMFMAQGVVPAMRQARRGAILNMSSTAWMKGATDLIAYTTAKAAMEGFTRSLSRELGPAGIRVNAIAPGWVLTPRQLREHATPERRAANLAAQALKREVKPDDIANAALFLCSDSAAAITGQTLIVDGGISYG